MYILAQGVLKEVWLHWDRFQDPYICADMKKDENSKYKRVINVQHAFGIKTILSSYIAICGSEICHPTPCELSQFISPSYHDTISIPFYIRVRLLQLLLPAGSWNFQKRSPYICVSFDTLCTSGRSKGF